MLTVTFNPALDLSARIPVVEPDRKLHCTDLEAQPGGGGINVARVATHLGADCRATFPAGGSSGETLCRALEAERVATVVVPVRTPTRENLTVLETSSGRQYRFLLPGATLSDDELDRCATAWAGHIRDHADDYVVFSGSLPDGMPTSLLTDLITTARRCGRHVVVDTSGPALTRAAETGTLLLKPSVNELGAFVGRPLTTHGDFDGAARQLLAAGDNHAVLVSLAAAGALLVQRDRPSVWIHAPGVRAVSTVGAGDSMVAGMVVSLQRGASLVDAARFGVAAGTAAVLQGGPSLCRSQDIARLLPIVRVSDDALMAP